MKVNKIQGLWFENNKNEIIKGRSHQTITKLYKNRQ